jgi:hypothetical protein
MREDETNPEVEFVALASAPAVSADATSVWWIERVQGDVFRLAL